MNFIYFVTGFLVLGFAGEATLRGAVQLATQLKISPAVIGLTVIGFGTSLPELTVCLEAALNGKPDLAIGNIVGSNIANLSLVLGICALVFPLTCEPSAIRRDGSAMILATIICVGCSIFGEIQSWSGIAMLITLLMFLAWSYKIDRASNNVTTKLHEKEADAVRGKSKHISVNLSYIVIGLIGLTFGASLLIEGAVGIARSFSVSESIIGLTMVALGTSLPELFATIIAALRRNGDVAIGNVLGSNIFNILGTLGITAAIRPLQFALDICTIDVWVMLGVTIVALKLMITKWRISRIEGTLLLCFYAAYVGSLAMRGIIKV